MKLFSKTLIFSLLLVFFAIGCEEDVEFVQPPSAVSFDSDKVSVEIDPNAPTFEITLQTTAAFNADKAIPFSIVHDTLDDLNNTAPVGDYTLTDTLITIPAGKLKGSSTLKFDKDKLGYVAKGLKFKLNDGDYIANVSRDELELSFVKLCSFKKVILTISTDGFPEETTYELYNMSSGSPVLLQSGGPYDDLENTDVSTTFCLDTGSYAVVVYDSYGDGISGDGFKVTLEGEELVSKTVAGSYAIGYFDVP